MNKENPPKAKSKPKPKKNAPLIHTVPNDPLDFESEATQETTFERIVKASNAAYEDIESFEDDSFDESACFDAIRQEMI